MEKSLLLEHLQNERDQFELLLNRVGFTRRLTMRGVMDRLTVKDLLAEVLSHEQFIADRLSEITHGETYAPSASFAALENFQREYGYPDYESSLLEEAEFHPFILDTYKTIGFEDMVSEELAVYASILELIEKLTPHQFLDHDLYDRIRKHTYRPYRHVSGLIHRWLKRITSEPK